MGGPPSKGTPKDMRLKANNPSVGKKTPAKTAATTKQPPQPKKGGA